jgi:hypothetical protein
MTSFLSLLLVTTGIHEMLQCYTRTGPFYRQSPADCQVESFPGSGVIGAIWALIERRYNKLTHCQNLFLLDLRVTWHYGTPVTAKPGHRIWEKD